jgi:site-specific recombinase XerD
VKEVLEYVEAAEGSLRHGALAKNTWRSYKCGLRRWIAFARVRGISVLQPDMASLAECIEHYHETGVTASAIDTMCTAVSTVFAWKTGERLGQVIVERDYAGTSLRTCLRRTATLLVLCHAMRFTEMEGIMKGEVKFGGDRKEVEFMIALKTEQRRKRRIIIKEVVERPGVCVVRAIQSVLSNGRTAVPELFAMGEGESSRKMSASQISLLVREVMTVAGIPDYVTPYNAKHVGLTKAWEAGASEDELRDVARWAKNSEQFRRHYRVRESTERVVKLIIGGE